MPPADAPSPSWRPTFTLDQDRPAEICPIPPREVEEREITHNNPASCYGISSVLRRYARLPEDFPVQVSAEHFICYQPDRVIEWDIDAGYRTFLAIDANRALRYREAGMPRALPTGSPLHYALRLHEKAHGPLPLSHERRGTLVFPHKSDAVVRDRFFDHGPMIQWMNALPEEYHPIYVCLYWKDYNKGDGKPFEEAGYPVLSCGHWMHDDFLLRFVEMCGQFRYVAANTFSSSFPLSVLCGCHFMYVETGGHIEQHIGGQTIVHTTDPTRDTVYGKEACPITTFPPVASHRPKQLALARAMSGYKHVRHRWRMWWLLCQEARHLASLRGNGLDFADGKITWKEVRPWCCQGVELDGWMHTNVSLIAPGGRETDTLVIDLELYGWCEVSNQQLMVEVAGQKGQELNVKKGRQLLHIPLPRKKRDVQVRLVFAQQFPLPGEVRTACARLLRFRLEKTSPARTAIVLERMTKGEIA